MKDTIMKTDRMILRKMRRDDAENLLEIFSDPTAMEYYPSTKNEKQTLHWIDWTLENYEKHGTGLWVAEHKQTGEFLGQCGIVPQEVEGSDEMEIGYLFKRSVWKNGYATEAASACKQYGFEAFHLKKIVSLPDAKNLPSRKVAERIGMTLEKTIHKWGKEIAVYSVYR
ncbi:GNAT family N-acetyltransferase [Bacillus paralicheniformis]|uniref:GNAT family N-acetyltransferase n=1 Tax=Bacillus TaxID=1386 RepID=UPI000CDB64F3|nr:MULTISPECIES: GNAT family N-acetyltransferase [Bacillus]POO77211.1 GNAT family N-acetyltransferase [Bacillus sp. MBGLi97]MCU4668234.1 GNAT family N-acetyltransferase [Bacillus paralicheniformis]MDR9799664.1 GNAT family N-acetyltransferase [Bacillus paralicheniformis]MDW6053768.1 GNAT family N-acetyltransferase [Bacillus paralicheniformis]MEC1825619.1 GNAT family N-acetyltransferase [Bacillus paralicheniformis]